MMRKIKSRSASGPPRFFVCVPCPARRAQGIITEGIKPSGKTQTFPPHTHIQRRRAFPASLSVAGTTCIFPFSPLLSMTSPLCPPGGGKGPVMGALPPFEAPFQTPESPPYLALSLCVHCPPVPTKASLSEQAGAPIHPRMGGGMKLRQGDYPLCVPRPAVGGIAGVRARPENPRAPSRAVQREGCRHDVGLGRAPPCDPVPTSPSVPKAKLLLEHEDAGRTGRRSTLKGKGDSGGGCKEGPRGGNRRFPTTGPSLAPPGGRRG